MRHHLMSLTALALLLATPSPAAGLTTDAGAPLIDNTHSETAGDGGPVLLQDFQLIEKLARFDRERIPERVVHARGAGAFGTFTASGAATPFTRIKMLGQKGKQTPMFVRFSTVIHPSGSPESLRDPRGFALKFYTEEGNWDVVGNNLDVFFIRDAISFPDMVHSLKMSPVTNQQDPNRFFAFFANHPESTHMLTQLYSDLGVPASYRTMNGSSVHAFVFDNSAGQRFYGKLRWVSLQGEKGLVTPAEQNQALVDGGASFATKDLYDAIAKKDLPQWRLEGQFIPVERVNAFSFNPLDATKRWPLDEVPPVVLGTFTLNKVPDNFFATSEQAAFSPGVMVPGVSPSEDRLLQGRLFSYADTQRHRLGAAYQQLSINAPRVAVNNTQSPALVREQNFDTTPPTNPTAGNKRYQKPAGLDEAFARLDNFSQAGVFYRGLDVAARARLVDNFAGDLAVVADEAVRSRMIEHIKRADRDYGAALEQAVQNKRR